MENKLQYMEGTVSIRDFFELLFFTKFLSFLTHYDPLRHSALTFIYLDSAQSQSVTILAPNHNNMINATHNSCNKQTNATISELPTMSAVALLDGVPNTGYLIN